MISTVGPDRPIAISLHNKGPNLGWIYVRSIQKNRPKNSFRTIFGGAYWTRTSDPIDVNDVLYHSGRST